MRRPTNVKLAWSANRSCAQLEQILQYEDGKTNARGTCTLPNSHEFHDQYGCPESSLEAVHGEEGRRFQGVPKEEHDSEYINQEYDDNEEHEHNNRAKDC